MNTCKDCTYWKQVEQTTNLRKALNLQNFFKGGACHHEKLGENSEEYCYRSDELNYPYDEGGEFWVGADFGCIHFESKENQT